MKLRSISVLSILALSACESGPIELSVDVRTDLDPESDFDRAWVELTPSHGPVFQPVERAASESDMWREGARVADFIGVPAGPLRVRAMLFDAVGAIVIQRDVEFSITSSYGLTIVLSASCVGRECPGDLAPSTFSECVSGVCVEPTCAGPMPRGCGTIECETSSNCEGRLDCHGVCLAGACVCSSARDGGPPCDCDGDEVMSEVGESCERCGVMMRTRMCDGCRWGDFTDWSCQNRGPCIPNTVSTDCDECGQQTCQSNCQWGPCVPINTAANGCLRVRPGSGGTAGSNFWCCMPEHWSFCLEPPDCRWSNTCASCLPDCPDECVP